MIFKSAGGEMPIVCRGIVLVQACQRLLFDHRAPGHVATVLELPLCSLGSSRQPAEKQHV